MVKQNLFLLLLRTLLGLIKSRSVLKHRNATLEVTNGNTVFDVKNKPVWPKPIDFLGLPH